MTIVPVPPSDLPKRWFHGTRLGVKYRGGILVPPIEHGKGRANLLNHPTHDRAAEYWVYITPYPEVAMRFALTAMRGKGWPKVLEVMPIGPIYDDHATYGGEDGWMYRVGSAFVMSVLHKVKTREKFPTVMDIPPEYDPDEMEFRL